MINQLFDLVIGYIITQEGIRLEILEEWRIKKPDQDQEPRGRTI